LAEKQLLAQIGLLQSELSTFRADSPISIINPTSSIPFPSNWPIQSSNDEIIRLNVGGTIFSTVRSTLCSVPGSMLEAMFSGRFGMPSLRDESGAYFLDRDPTYFGFILSYLRDPRNRPVARAQLSRLAILREFEYFGLLPDAGVYVAEPGSSIICTHHLELVSRFSSMSVYGSKAYVSTETHIELWCLDGQECKRKLKLAPGVLVRSLEATATRCFVLCGDCDIQVWDAELQVMLKRIEPNTGWASHFQIVHDLFDSPPSNCSYSAFNAYEESTSSKRRTLHPIWSFSGSQKTMNKRSLLFFDGDSGIYALDLDSLSISNVIEVKEQEVPMAFHVSGEELYYATEGTLNSFNLRSYKKALLSSTAIEFKRIRAIENELIVCWDTMGDRLIHFDLRTRNWTSATPSDRWHPLTEQCEVFRSLVVGRDFSNRIVLWCTNPLISEDVSFPANMNDSQHGHSYTSSLALLQHQQSNTALTTRVISLFNEATPTASSYFFQFQGSSIVVATSSPNEARNVANGLVGAIGAGTDATIGGDVKNNSLASGSIRVFSIRR
jgi:hypothetical protein